MNRTELLAMFPHATEAFLKANASDGKPVAPKEERPGFAACMGSTHGLYHIKRDERRESELQAYCERWLRSRGYMPMTAKNAEIEAESSLRAGWFGHLHNPQENPLMPDLMIYDAAMRHCLMIELKVRDKYQPGQREMIALGCWKEARTFEVVTELVKEWEREIGA